MSSLGPLPPLGATSLPPGVSQEQWEKSFKDAMRGGAEGGPGAAAATLGAPVAFPDASTCALVGVARGLPDSAAAAAADAAQAGDAEQQRRPDAGAAAGGAADAAPQAAAAEATSAPNAGPASATQGTPDDAATFAAQLEARLPPCERKGKLQPLAPLRPNA
eukprot:TRINITY_DN29105_c0_g1_i1.p4 TRINITY_DN29105_c0_g1~~TRINITY_DN29105_c0_g1_i1.p4  ORF type:complete len:162 (+),score=54.76 TRINITY_DN29105_c0_g1_i1:88-573(+)